MSNNEVSPNIVSVAADVRDRMMCSTSRYEARKYSGESYPPRYARKARHCAFGVEHLFGVDVDEETERRWGALIFMTKVLDTHLDEGDDTQESIEGRIQDCVDFINNRAAVAELFPELSVDNVGENTYQEMRYFGEMSIRLKQDVASATALDTYITMRRLEGRQFARLISCMATEDVQRQDGYTTFRNWLVPVGEVANLSDSLMDIGGDYRRGEVRIHPGVRTRLRLLGAMAMSTACAKTTARNDRRRTSRTI